MTGRPDAGLEAWIRILAAFENDLAGWSDQPNEVLDYLAVVLQIAKTHGHCHCDQYAVNPVKTWRHSHHGTINRVCHELLTAYRVVQLVRRRLIDDLRNPRRQPLWRQMWDDTHGRSVLREFLQKQSKAERLGWFLDSYTMP